MFRTFIKFFQFFLFFFKNWTSIISNLQNDRGHGFGLIWQFSWANFLVNFGPTHSKLYIFSWKVKPSILIIFIPSNSYFSPLKTKGNFFEFEFGKLSLKHPR